MSDSMNTSATLNIGLNAADGIRAAKEFDAAVQKSMENVEKYVNSTKEKFAQLSEQTEKLAKTDLAQHLGKENRGMGFRNRNPSNFTDETRELKQQADMVNRYKEAEKQRADAATKSADAISRASQKIQQAQKNTPDQLQILGARRNANLDALSAVGSNVILRANAQRRIEEDRLVNDTIKKNFASNEAIRVRTASEAEKRITDIQKKANSERIRDQQRVDRVIQRSLQANAAMQAKIANAVNSASAVAQRQVMMAQQGLTRTQAIMAQLAPIVGQQGAAYLAGGGGNRPPNLGGGRQGGFFGRGFGAFAASAATSLGIGVGGYMVGRAVQSVTEATQTATAYERQRVAAERLAGSQGQLNAMMDAYTRASGGAVAETAELAAVTRLMATGFAQNAEQVEKAVRATRGASIAMGKPQEDILQETQLAAANTSFRRLDQIGLGIDEVREKMAQLRAENSKMTREQAFTQSVLDLLDKKYGHLSTTLVGQASGVEKLAKAWDDLGLSFGQTAKGPLDAITNYFANRVNDIIEVLDYERVAAAKRKLENILNEEMGSDIWGNSNRGTASFIYESGQRQLARRRAAVVGDAPAPAPRYSEEAIAGIMDFQRRERDINRAYQQNVLQETQSYAQQRQETIAQYEKTIAREAEDFAIQRARAEENYQKSVARLLEDNARRDALQADEYGRNVARARRDADERLSRVQDDFARQELERRQDNAERLAEWQEDFDNQQANERRDSLQRQNEISRDYERQRERAIRDSNERILQAASRLDARAIVEEQRQRERLAEEQREARDEAIAKEQESIRRSLAENEAAYRERLEDEAKAQNKQRERAQEAHNRQIDDLNNALEQQLIDMADAYNRQQELQHAEDARRLTDMQTAFDDQKKLEDADRSLRLGRMAQDHTDQLNAQAAAHQLRMNQISAQAAAEREQWWEEFNTFLGEQNLQSEAWYLQQETLKEAAIKAFEEFWEKVTKTITSTDTTKPNQPVRINPDTGEAPVVNPSRPGDTPMIQELLNRQKMFAPNTQQYKSLQLQIDYLRRQANSGQASASSIMPAPATAPVVSASSVGGASTTIGALNPTLVFGDIGTKSPTDIKRIVGEAMVELVQKAASRKL